MAASNDKAPEFMAPDSKCQRHVNSPVSRRN